MKSESYIVILSWQQACEIEVSLISLYGRRDLGTGLLTNMTDGGEGQCNPSMETRKKISRSNTGKKRSKETKRKLSLSQSGKKNHNYGKSFSIETKKKLSESQKGEKGNRYGKSAANRRKVKIKNKVFTSVSFASKSIGISRSGLRNRLNSNNYPDYNYV